LRFELARILFTRPALLVLDEPLANLDRNAQLALLDDLKMLCASVDTPRSIVISSQQIDEIESISDHLVFLSNGDVLFSGPREDVIGVLDYSLFEVSVTDRLDDLEMLLRKCGALEIDHTPVSVQALFPKGTSQEVLVRAMLDAGLRVKNFRDLSNAIELLLLMPRFKSSRQARESRTGKSGD
jgi:ABC-type multidrug transport system ATPase subunit